jgi:membrane associated rhomboid family serine protease
MDTTSQKIVIEDEGWRPLAPTMIQAGLVQYFTKVLALRYVGVAIEMTRGWVPAAIILTISAVGGAIMSAIFLPEEYTTVGASGGIFGFIGACLADIIMNSKLLFTVAILLQRMERKYRHAMIVVVLLLDICLNSIIGLTPFVDNSTRTLVNSTTLSCWCAHCAKLLTNSFFFSLVPRTKICLS